MKKWFEWKSGRRLLSLALSIVMVLSLLPAGALAEEGEITPPSCSCEAACAEGAVNTACSVCAEDTSKCAVKEPEPKPEPEPEPVPDPVPAPETCAHDNDPETCETCASEARIASVQALIKALPEDVTAETRETVQSALSAVDAAKSALTEAEQRQLDMTRYSALTEKLAELEAQMNKCTHGNDPAACEACASEARVASVQALIDELPDADSITLDKAEAVVAQMGEIDEIAMLLTEDEQNALDFTKYDAAAARLSELAEQENPEQTAVWDTVPGVPYLDASGTGQTMDCVAITAEYLTANSYTLSSGWYVVQGEVTIGAEDAPQRVTVSGEVHLILANGCDLTVSGGIGVSSGNSLTIYAQSADENMGSLTARNVADHNTGIGGGDKVPSGDITINGGTVTATGDNYGAGIGGGYYCSSDRGTITINGGTVTAYGGYSGAGIGSSSYGSIGTITINGGTVYAYGGQQGAGIGGGYFASGGTVIINNGEITATGGNGGAGIGGGEGKDGGTIMIEGGKVIASTSDGAGIGGGHDGDGGKITISGGDITATGGNSGAGIGGGSQGSGGTITINGGTVTATGGEYGAGIGGGEKGSDGTFSTGTNGSAVIFASSISDKSNQSSWSGIIFEDGNDGTVYGDQTLSADLTIASNQTLIVPENTTLTVPAGVTLTYNGTIVGSGKVYVDGTLTGNVSGNVYYLLTLNDCTASGDVTTYPEGGKLYGKAGSSITLTAEPSAGQMVTGWQFSDNTIVDTGNSFIMPEHAVTVRAVFGDIVASVRVGDTVTNYAFFSQAFDAANHANGSTLKLHADVTADETLCTSGSFTLDLNGFKLTSDEIGSEAISVNGSLTITDSSEEKTGTIYRGENGYVVQVQNQGTVTISGGTLKKQAGSNIFNTAAGITLTGGSFPDGISFPISFADEGNTVRSLLKGGEYAFYDLDAYTNQSGTRTLVSVDNERTNIDCGVVVLEHLEHTFSCKRKDDYQHTATCGCGYSETVNHDFKDNNGFCKQCGAYEPAKENGGVYEISNAGQLFWFGNYASNANAKLMADIDASDTSGARSMWFPIGGGESGYSGTFDGNGKTISGLNFSPDRGSYTSTNVGFFGKVSYGTIENLTIADCGVNEAEVKENSNIALLCGYLERGTIQGCTIAKYPVHLPVQLDYRGSVAGICGYNDGGWIRDCTNSADLSHSSTPAAGICYENHGTIEGCTNTGNIKGNSAGGICNNNKGSILKCTNTGNIHGNPAGGICVNNGSDWKDTASIQNCANHGQISGEGSVGGICALNYGTVSNCYHFDSLNGGYIVGENQQDAIFSNCYYLADQETDNLDGTTAKTAAQFRSGEVAYLLNGEAQGNNWGQTLAGEKKQNYPVLGGPHVHHYTFCPFYSNIEGLSRTTHSPDENGICERCRAALEASVKDGDTITYYTSLKDAFEAVNKAAENDKDKTATITLLRNVEIGEDEELTIFSGNVTFQGGEHTLTVEEKRTAIVVQENGTFNFESGILRIFDGQGIHVIGGTLNFKGGTLKFNGETSTEPMENCSIIMNGGAVTISDGAVGFVSASTGTLNISGGIVERIAVWEQGSLNIEGGTVGSIDVQKGFLDIEGGTVDTLSVKGEKTRLSGGTFGQINVADDKKVSDLLADGCAYKLSDGTWVDATNGNNEQALSGSIQVLSIPVSITKQPEGISFTYGDTDKQLTVEASGSYDIAYQWYQVTTGEGGAPMESPVGTGDRFNLSELNAGSYSFFCRLTCDKYVLNSDPVTVTVNKAIVETPTVDSKVYNGTLQTADVPASERYTESENTGGTNAGSYDVVLTLTDSDNYQWDNKGGKTSFQITKATSNSWTTEPAIDRWTYGDTPSNPTAAATFGTVTVEYKSEDGITSYGTTPPTNAGDYKAVFSVAETDNYVGIEPTAVPFTISPKAITVTITPNGGTYGNVTAATAVANDLVVSDVVPVTLTYTGTANDGTVYENSPTAPSKAGSYTVTASISDGNYKLTGDTTASFTISPKEITVTSITAQNRTYDGTDTATITNVVFTGKEDADSLDVSATGTFENANVGETKTVTSTSFTLTGAAAGNYKLSENQQMVATTAKITPKELTVTNVRMKNKQYDGLNTATIDGTPTLDGVIEADKDNVTLVNGTPTFKTVNVANDIEIEFTTDFSISGNASGNYTLTQPASVTASITPKSILDSDITVTLDQTSFVYDGTEKTLKVTVQFGTTTLVEGTDYTLSGNTATASGSHTLTVMGMGNYSGTAKRNWQITSTPITPVVTIADAVYGEKLNPSVTSGNPGNGAVTYTYYSDTACTKEVTPKDVGTYYVMATVAQTDSYPSGTSQAVPFQITKKALTVTAKDHTITYGDAPANNGVTYEGFVNGETETVLSGQLTYTYSYSRYGDVGSSYTITPAGLSSDNYNIIFAAGTLTVQKKEITITGTTVAASKVYDGNTTAQITFNGNLSANYDSTNLTIVPGSAAYDSKNVGDNKEVTFSGFSLGGSAKDNYVLTAQPASVSANITAKPVTLVITVAEKAFDGTTDGVSFVTKLTEENAFVEGDKVEVVNGEAAFAQSAPGNDIAVSFTPFTLTGDDAGNYSIINPQPENVTGNIKPSSRYLDLDGNTAFDNQTEVWVDGVAYPVKTVNGTYVALPEDGDLLTVYTYQKNTSDLTHDNYPTGMAVYRITRTENGATVENISAFSDLLQYSGSSIRITGKRGIRMITSLTKGNKKALTGSGLAGYTLEEYGTVVQWADDLHGASLTLANGKHNYAYKKGVADPVFNTTGDLTQYTNVLVWDSLTNAQLGQDIVMRPYIILKGTDGKQVTLYGGTVSRSIGYIAYQNRAVFNPGTAAYKYVWDIIHAVYGKQYDSDYKG